MVRQVGRLTELEARRCGEGVKRGISPPIDILRQLVRDYSQKLGESFARAMNVDVGRFGREIDVGK